MCVLIILGHNNIFNVIEFQVATSNTLQVLVFKMFLNDTQVGSNQMLFTDTKNSECCSFLLYQRMLIIIQMQIRLYYCFVKDLSIIYNILEKKIFVAYLVTTLKALDRTVENQHQKFLPDNNALGSICNLQFYITASNWPCFCPHFFQSMCIPQMHSG